MNNLFPFPPHAGTGRPPGPGCRPICVALLGLLLLIPAACPARGWIGVSIQDVSPALRDAMDLPSSTGALVSDVVNGGPAEEAGIRARDVIVRADRVEVESSADLTGYLREKDPGDHVLLALLRDAKRLEIEVVLSERPAVERPDVPVPPRWDLDQPPASRPDRESPERLQQWLERLDRRVALGVSVHALDPHLADYFGVEPGEGLLVLAVEPESPAADAGLLPGDVLQEWNGSRLSRVDELTEAVRRMEPGDRWEAVVRRHGKRMEFNGRIERSARPKESIEGLHRFILPPRAEGERPLLDQRTHERLERQVERLRERIRRLEQKIESMRDR